MASVTEPRHTVLDAKNQTDDFPKRIGPVPLAHPFTLAALSGYSDMGMRVTCRAQGACMTRNEVILDQFVVAEGGGPRSGRFLDADDHPVAVQLMGNDAGRMAEAARLMVPWGYDMVDINFGCPVKKVLGRCRGGFLLGEPETAIEMMARVREAVDVPVTVKMRRGRDDSPLSRERFWQILEAGVRLGIDAVTIHGRTVDQRYVGRADWSILAEAKAAFPDLIIFGSGDLFSANDCLRMLAETGIDGVTIARGAIENPFIFRDCLALWHGKSAPPRPSVLELADHLDRHYRLAIEQYGPEKASRQMRKFGIKQAWLHPQAEQLREAFITLSQPSEWDEVRRRFFGPESQALVHPNDGSAERARANLWSCGCD